MMCIENLWHWSYTNEKLVQNQSIDIVRLICFDVYIVYIYIHISIPFSASVIIKLIQFFSNSDQEQRLRRLQERLHVPFDETRPDHQALHSFNIHIVF